MNLVPLAPAVVGIVLLLLKALYRNAGHSVIDGDSTYTYPRAPGYLLLFMALLSSVCPWLLPLLIKNGKPGSFPVGLAAALTAVAVFGFIWLRQYRVSLGVATIRCGSFFIREFRYADIARVKYLGSAVKGQFMMYAPAKSRWPMTVYSSINDFSSFLDEIKKRLPNTVVIERRGRGSRYDGG